VSAIASLPRLLGRRTSGLIGVAGGATVITFALRVAGADPVAVFVAAGIALAGLAAVVGDGTDQLGHRLGPGATGVLQSALGNLPELFISLFALKAGLVVLVQTALIGSILANSLLVLGLAFVFGGLRNGVQRFGAEPTRMIATLLVLAVAGLTIPTLATAPRTPATLATCRSSSRSSSSPSSPPRSRSRCAAGRAPARWHRGSSGSGRSAWRSACWPWPA
jgi:Ca2+:H+ antiporter